MRRTLPWLSTATSTNPRSVSYCLPVLNAYPYLRSLPIYLLSQHRFVINVEFTWRPRFLHVGKFLCCCHCQLQQGCVNRYFLSSWYGHFKLLEDCVANKMFLFLFIESVLDFISNTCYAGNYFWLSPKHFQYWYHVYLTLLRVWLGY